MKRRWLSFSILFALILSVLLIPHRSTYAAPTLANPTLIAEVNGSGKGRVWVGAIPPYSSSKPVLVFVHGLHGKAPNWWGATTYSGTNDMYAKAYASGYRTAFVSLDDEVDGPASSIWANGATLNRQLDVILNYYGVSSVNLIAHSKGGVDTNSAVVHYGASSKVQRIVTLSSPHHGSELADLAYSWWAGWLASLLGQRDDGTYTMQTSYMSYFRSVTDSSSAYNNVRFYTSGGTNHGSFFSAMWWGGAYLPGDNDGVVTVNSSNHPRQTARLFTANLNHDNIRKGSEVWTRIEPTVRTFFRARPADGFSTIEAAPATATSNTRTLNQILRGGELTADSATLQLPIESGVSSVAFDLLSNSADLAVTFVGPNGEKVASQQPIADTDTFRGAWHYTAKLDAPSAGAWQVLVNGKVGTGYLLVANLTGGQTVVVDQPLSVKPGAALNVQTSAKGASTLSINGLLSGTPTGRQLNSQMTTQSTLSAAGTSKASLSTKSPSSVGLYQLGLTVTGTSADGSQFERSLASNFAVLTGSEGIDALPAGR